jgi:hypothetical protein
MNGANLFVLFSQSDKIFVVNEKRQLLIVFFSDEVSVFRVIMKNLISVCLDSLFIRKFCSKFMVNIYGSPLEVDHVNIRITTCGRSIRLSSDHNRLRVTLGNYVQTFTRKRIVLDIKG